MSNGTSTATLSFPMYFLAIMLVLIVAGIVEGATPARLLRVFPSPIVMFILVLCVSLIDLAVNKSSSFFYLLSQQAIDSEVLQTIYLPPLLFSDVMRLNLRVFAKSFWQVNWLVFPGVIGGAALTALFPLYLMPSGPPFFSAYEAFAFGSALSTTDPIAVLMILNDVGAPKRLAAIVGGESLLNDGSSIVLVTLFLQLQDGVDFTAGQIVAFCFKEVLVGPCIGFGLGLVTLFFMRVVRHNSVALVALSFAVPYLTFAICAFYADTSGVLAVITLGLVLNRFGSAFLYKDLEAVEGFWDEIEFFAVMTLYAQVGVFVAADFLQGSITGTDWGSLFALFLYILFVRLVVIVVSYPVLVRTGYGMNWREAIVVWHAGLRGAIGILLSLSIKNSPGVTQRTGALVLFFTAGVVVLMLLNVVTAKPLCNLLGIRFDSSNKVYVRMRAKIEENTLHTLMCTGMQEDFARKGIEPSEEHESAATEGNNKRDDYVQSTGGESKGTHEMERAVAFAEVLDDEMLSEKRRHLCLAFRATFQGLLEAELIPRRAWFFLVNACERRTDRVPVTGLLRLADVIGPGSWFNLIARAALSSANGCFLRTPANHKRLKEVLLDRFEPLVGENWLEEQREEDNKDLLKMVETVAYCAFGLLIAHQRARRLVNEIFSAFEDDEEDNLTPKDKAERKTKSKRSRIKYPREVKRILDESKRDCERPAQLIDFIFAKFPKVIQNIKSAHAKAQVHSKNIQLLASMKRSGFAQGVALKQLYGEIERIDAQVAKLNFPVLAPRTVGEAGEDLLANPNFGPFAALSPLAAPPYSRLISGAIAQVAGRVAQGARSREPKSPLAMTKQPKFPSTTTNEPQASKMEESPRGVREELQSNELGETTALPSPHRDASEQLALDANPEALLDASVQKMERDIKAAGQTEEDRMEDEPAEESSTRLDDTESDTQEQSELNRVLDQVEKDLAETDIEEDPNLRVTL